MYRLIKKLSIVTSVALGVSVFCVVSTTANAESADQTEVSQATSSATTEATAYEYTAKPGDSLSKLVRRSIQLLNQAKNNKMTDAAAMYCETNAVQRLGSTYLDIEQKVSVPFSVLQEYIDNAKNLTSEQLARWQKYADRADFASLSATPDNADAAKSVTTTPPPPADQTEQPPADQPTKEQNNEQTNQTSNSSLAWYWWVLGILGIGAVYYLAGRRISK